jgi:hypothetical protein
MIYETPFAGTESNTDLAFETMCCMKYCYSIDIMYGETKAQTIFLTSIGNTCNLKKIYVLYINI